MERMLAGLSVRTWATATALPVLASAVQGSKVPAANIFRVPRVQETVKFAPETASAFP